MPRRASPLTAFAGSEIVVVRCRFFIPMTFPSPEKFGTMCKEIYFAPSDVGMNDSYQQGFGELWCFAGYELNAASRTLQYSGRGVDLEAKTFDLLALLVSRAGQVLSKDELLSSIWTRRIVSESLLAKCVVKARAALGEQGPALIRTVHGVGYRFDGTVQRRRLSVPAAPVPGLVTGDMVPGRLNWRLVRRLAEHAETWLARHDKTQEQRVFKFALDALALEGLRREVTVSRMLAECVPGDAPFTRIADWDFEVRPPYVEMPYSSGESLEHWAAAQGSLTSVPMATRLEVLAQAADGLALAHTAGIIHRDLKPGNLLIENVDGQPRVRIADFGVSALSEPERLEALAITRMDFGSAVGDVAGTLMYLAPEVVAGQSQTLKSDLYALGVLLYQLVVGDLRRPFAPGWERAVEDELLRADIAASAEVDPVLRLGDAGQLARGLRSLAQRRAQLQQQRDAAQAVLRAEAALQRSRQQRRWVLAIAASLALGLCLSLLMYLRASREHRRAEEALATSQAVVSFLSDDMLSAANPLAVGGGRNVTVASLLDKAAAQLDQRLQDRPALRARLSYAIARAYQNLGLLREARDLLQRQRSSMRNADLDDLLSLQFLQADIDTELDEYEEARQLLDNVLAQLGSQSPAADADLLMDARLTRAWLDFELGWYAKSVQGFESIIDAAAHRAPRDDEAILEARWWMVDPLIELNRIDEAERQILPVVDVYLQRYGRDSARYLWARLSLAEVRQAQGRFDEAGAILVDIEERIGRTLGEAHNIALWALQERASIDMQQGRPAEAIPLLQRAIRLRDSSDGEAFHASILARQRLGHAYLQLGRVAEARPLLEQAYAAILTRLGESHPYTMRVAESLAQARMMEGDLAGAEGLLTSALARACDRVPADHFTRGHLQLRLAELRQLQGRTEDAAAAQAEGRRILVAVGPWAQSTVLQLDAMRHWQNEPPQDLMRDFARLPL